MLEAAKIFATAGLLMFALNANAANDQALRVLTPDISRPVRLEILVAAQGNDLFSIAGHFALRARYTDIDHQDRDFYLGFEPNRGEEKEGLKSFVKSAAPIYPMTMTIKPFNECVEKNVLIENRSLQRYILNTSHSTSENLFSLLRSAVQNQLSFGKYTFLTNNCVTGLYELLGQAGYYINKRLKDETSPPPFAMIGMYLHPVLLGLLEAPEIKAPGVNKEFIRRVFATNIDSSSDQKSAFEQDLGKLTVAQLNLLLLFDLSEYPTLRNLTYRELHRRSENTIMGTMELAQIQEMPDALYEMCKYEACAERYAQALYQKLGPKKTKRFYLDARYEALRAEQLYVIGTELPQTAQYRHYTLVQNAIYKILSSLPR